MSDRKTSSGRRTFLRKSLVGLAGAVLSPSLLRSGQTETAIVSEKKKKSIVRPLGKTGLSLPVISIGAVCFDEALYRKALDEGIVHIDTSQYAYGGRHEELIGRAVKGRPRDSFVVATSILLGSGAPGAFSTMRKEDAPKFPEQLNASLKRLGLDYVDIFYVAATDSRETALDEPLLEALRKIKHAGKSRFVGVAAHQGQAEVLKAIAAAKSHDVALVAYNFRDPRRAEIEAALFEAGRAGIGLIVMKPMAGAFWDKQRKQPINGTAALKWILQNENVTTIVPGIESVDQLEADLAVMENPVLTAEERADLKLADGEAPHGLYCLQCGTCEAQCLAGLEIPVLMRSYMYAYGYGDLGRARAALQQADLSRLQCLDCGTCRVSCTMGFDVRERALDIARLNGDLEALLR